MSKHTLTGHQQLPLAPHRVLSHNLPKKLAVFEQICQQTTILAICNEENVLENVSQGTTQHLKPLEVSCIFIPVKRWETKLAAHLLKCKLKMTEIEMERFDDKFAKNQGWLFE